MLLEKINIVKICVGAKEVEDLWLWQKEKLVQNPENGLMHITRMTPKRENELLNGGSIYWVFEGYILARQKILSLNRVRAGDGIMKCGIALDQEIKFLTEKHGETE